MMEEPFDCNLKDIKAKVRSWMPGDALTRTKTSIRLFVDGDEVANTEKLIGILDGTVIKAVFSIEYFEISHMDMRADMGIIRAIKIPMAVTRIRKRGFHQCNGVVEVQATTWLESMGTEAFEGCDSLEVVNAPGLREIRRAAFRDCRALRVAPLPPGLQIIGRDAFNGCFALSGLFIPATVRKIGADAFRGCVGLDSVEIHAPLSNMPQGIFSLCRSLKHVNLNTVLGLSSIEDYAFQECVLLEGIKLASSVQKIGEGAFEKCFALRAVHLPDWLHQMGARCFKKCFALGEVRFGPGMKYIPEGAFEESGVRSVTLGTIERIDALAFHKCVLLRDVCHSGKVIMIGLGAFAHCTLLETIDESNVWSIHFTAFEGCINLLPSGDVRVRCV